MPESAQCRGVPREHSKLLTSFFASLGRRKSGGAALAVGKKGAHITDGTLLIDLRLEVLEDGLIDHFEELSRHRLAVCGAVLG